MALQNFVDYIGPKISAAWLNAVDILRETVFEDATTKAAARTALTLDAPLEVANGGTGSRVGPLHEQDARKYGILDDGTDQTTELVAVLSGFSSSGWRGEFFIPYGTSFDIATVYAAVPVGVWLKDYSSVNYGQGGYVNKVLATYSGDAVDDDTRVDIASGHHAALLLNNFGTAGTASAGDRYTSILRGAGIRWNKDPIIGYQNLTAKANGKDCWRTSWVLYTPWLGAKNSSRWTQGEAVSTGYYRDTPAGNLYIATSTGTCGPTVPSHTAGIQSDGGVNWEYVSAWEVQSTTFYFDEDGSAGLIGPDTARLTLTAGGNQAYFEVDDATNTVLLRDQTRGLNLLKVDDATGTQIGIAQSSYWIAISGTGPNAPATGAGNVTQSGATDMSTMVPPVGRTNMEVKLRFDDALTTVKHSAVANGFTLKGAVDATPAAGSFMTFEYDAGFSLTWIESSRSF